MPILYPATVERIKFYANFVLNAAALAVTWACLLAIGVGFNWLINWILETVAAPVAVGRYLDQLVWFYIIILGIAATLTSFNDVISLTKAGLSKSAVNPAEGAKDGEQEASPD